MPNKRSAEENSFTGSEDDITEAKALAMERFKNQNDPTFKKLEQALEEMPKQIRTFSEAMKMRFVVQALDDDSESSRKFQKLRNATKNDALVYLQAVLPVSEEVVSEIESLFEYFFKLSSKELSIQLNGMLEEFQNCRQLCEMAKTMNESAMVVLKQKEDEAKNVMMEIKELQGEYEKRKNEFEKSAALKRKIAIGIAFVPGINLIATPALWIAANSDKKDALVQGAQAQTQGVAATAVSETLIPALLAFINALGCVAGFFGEMENEIKKCHSKGERLRKEGMMDSLYRMFKSNAQNIQTKCKDFRMAVPAVKTDFQAICPDDGTDDTEIDHQYIFTRLKEMMRLTKGLNKEPMRIVDNLRRQISRQRQLANPSAKETYKFYVDEV